MKDYMSLTTGLVHIGSCSSIDVVGTDPSLFALFSHIKSMVISVVVIALLIF